MDDIAQPRSQLNRVPDPHKFDLGPVLIDHDDSGDHHQSESWNNKARHKARGDFGVLQPVQHRSFPIFQRDQLLDCGTSDYLLRALPPYPRTIWRLWIRDAAIALAHCERWPVELRGENRPASSWIVLARITGDGHVGYPTTLNGIMPLGISNQARANGK